MLFISCCSHFLKPTIVWLISLLNERRVCEDLTEVTSDSLALSTVCQVYCVMFLYQLSGSCGTPSSLSNGQRSYSSTIVRSRVTYTCNTGYLRTAGSSSRTCQSNGQWSGSHPTCTRKPTLYHFISFTY